MSTFKRCALEIVALVLVGLLVWYVTHDSVPRKPRRPLHASTHREEFKNGFFLVFDKPIVREKDGVKIAVFAVGRAKVHTLELKPDSDFHMDDPFNKVHIEKMIVLLKLSKPNSLLGEISYRPRNNHWVGGTRVGSCIDANLLDSPFGDARSYYENGVGVRIQPVVLDIPEKAVDRIGSEEYPWGDEDPICMATPVIDLSAKPDFGPAPVSAFKEKTLHLDRGIRLRLCDWLVGRMETVNGHQLTRQGTSYLTLRFYCVSGGESWNCPLQVVAKGANGEHVLLRVEYQGMGVESPSGYVGLARFIHECGSMPKNGHVSALSGTYADLEAVALVRESASSRFVHSPHVPASIIAGHKP